MTEFTPILSLAGGAMIGLSAVLLMALHGRIAGISGMLQGLLPPFAKDWGWRAAFLVGAIFAPVLILVMTGWRPAFDASTPTLWLVIGGLIVGAGVQLASGCTSGHGICGMSRLSARSIVATLSFMISTAVTVYVIRHIIGGF
ncbi:YeeE/YedE thiosulfate transporter family protein [Xinfangfangia sp. CPCC 101601]|uniref:YeeE/YedE thiosulfate transporter family protein n=1 Tax=Pseudogemmobacter lacusdianii TaxID=3069608 RepID=A0ABU0W1Q6_9RHOB|nr:YeeE/YedE thiosulfate transporter family protein [Xinfangfangia sp. CPCC 101601]MDQ2067957.1 YeeE/YedE thiosulfate transporter family protein [Xinfangfangia sp. CPCC 101601]